MTRKIGAWASAVAALGLAACGHVSNITTKPEGARVFLNGSEVCERTPCAYDGKVGIMRRRHLQIQKSGYRDVDLYVDNELNVLWFLGVTLTTGYFSTLVSSFVYNLDDSLSFQLEPLPGGPVPPASPSPAVAPYPEAPPEPGTLAPTAPALTPAR